MESDTSLCKVTGRRTPSRLPIWTTLKTGLGEERKPSCPSRSILSGYEILLPSFPSLSTLDCSMTNRSETSTHDRRLCSKRCRKQHNASTRDDNARASNSSRDASDQYDRGTHGQHTPPTHRGQSKAKGQQSESPSVTKQRCLVQSN